MSFSNITFQRGFSSIPRALREWRLVETRKASKLPVYNVGDRKPAFVPKQRKEFPDYKYGESNIFKQSNKGLYGGSFVQYGNNVSESKKKTRRRWLPNVIKKGLWSETLNRNVSIKMTAKVLRTITKEGGIDNYLVKDKSARIKELGPTGWKLRYRVLQQQEKKSNPPHQNAPIVEDAQGNKYRVYFEENVNGQSLRITVGRRKLLHFLYPLMKMEYKADGKELSHKEFLELYEQHSAHNIITDLLKLGFDVSTITV
ncbi:LAFE_0C03004g1_1 [Lachancea fermentati]|uniref:Large ribosomal subunit protein bL28m n=1 Tax=Lachancea fermentati TaxID=4955 RepID=A0A1G4M9F6_LACFM|nr:LAFE_0C03004g1_1 [Lachancea fermentati]